MKSKTILIALFCIGLSVSVSTFSQSRGRGGSTGGVVLIKSASHFSPISVNITDNEQIDVYFLSTNTSYEVTITNQSGHIVYKRNVNIQFTPQIIFNIKGLPTDSYRITFKNITTNEVTTNNFDIK